MDPPPTEEQLAEKRRLDGLPGYQHKTELSAEEWAPPASPESTDPFVIKQFNCLRSVWWMARKLGKGPGKTRYPSAKEVNIREACRLECGHLGAFQGLPVSAKNKKAVAPVQHFFNLIAYSYE